MAGKEERWVQTIRAKYRCGNDLLTKINRSLVGSNFWRGMCNSWPEVESNIVWCVGNGMSIRCWKEDWVPKVGKLVDCAQRPLHDAELFQRVCSWGSASGAWDL